MPKNSREKGKRGEREAAAELGIVFACEARRGVQYQGGHDSPDVVLEGVSVHVEAKRVEKLNLYDALKQAIRDCQGKTPIVWHRRNNEESVVIVRVSDLCDLARVIVETRRASIEQAEKA
jgi:hypothetical protein